MPHILRAIPRVGMQVADSSVAMGFSVVYHVGVLPGLNVKMSLPHKAFEMISLHNILIGNDLGIPGQSPE